MDLRTGYDDELPLSELNGGDLSLEMQLQLWQSHISTSVTVMKKAEVGQVKGISL